MTPPITPDQRHAMNVPLRYIPGTTKPAHDIVAGRRGPNPALLFSL